MSTIRRVLALTLAAVILVFAGATGAFATHREGHQETPSCDPHPTSGGAQNKHCEFPAPEEPETPVVPQTTPTPVPPPEDDEKADEASSRGPIRRGAVAPPADAVPATTLPFTGLDVPEALMLLSVLTALGAAALAMGKKRAARIE